MRLSLVVPLVTAGSIALMLSGLETAAPQRESPRAVFDQYCVTCHNEKLHTAGLALDKLDITNPGANAEVWERVIGKLRSGSMPPPGRPRPDVATYRAAATWLENEIDREWTASPNPGSE
jgi:mono/diheme cytochrome c family protein